MSEEQATYEEQGLSVIKQAMIKNALVKLKEGKSLTLREEALLEEAQRLRLEAQRKDTTTQGRNDTFKNLREVVGYLREQGWKISQAGIYKHSGQGKIKSEKDGTYTQKGVMRYAKGFLTTRETKRKEDDEELQRRKTKAEIALKEEQLKRERIKRMVEEGRFLLRETVDQELAGVITVILSTIKFAYMELAGVWIDLVRGDHERVGDLIRMLEENLDRTLNELDTSQVYQIKIIGNRSEKI